MSYPISRLVTLWFGMLKGHEQAVINLVYRENLTYSEKIMLESSLIDIKSNCDAILKSLAETKGI